MRGTRHSLAGWLGLRSCARPDEEVGRPEARARRTETEQTQLAASGGVVRLCPRRASRSRRPYGTADNSRYFGATSNGPRPTQTIGFWEAPTLYNPCRPTTQLNLAAPERARTYIQYTSHSPDMASRETKRTASSRPPVARHLVIPVGWAPGDVYMYSPDGSWACLSSPAGAPRTHARAHACMHTRATTFCAFEHKHAGAQNLALAARAHGTRRARTTSGRGTNGSAWNDVAARFGRSAWRAIVSSAWRLAGRQAF